MGPSDGFRREELDEVATGKHSRPARRIHDKCEAMIFAAFVGGLFVGAVIMDIMGG